MSTGYHWNKIKSKKELQSNTGERELPQKEHESIFNNIIDRNRVLPAAHLDHIKGRRQIFDMVFDDSFAVCLLSAFGSLYSLRQLSWRDRPFAIRPFYHILPVLLDIQDQGYDLMSSTGQDHHDHGAFCLYAGRFIHYDIYEDRWIK